MEHSALKEDQSLRAKCLDLTEGPQTNINRQCVRAAMNAMFMDRYSATARYNEKVQHWQGHGVKSELIICVCLLARGWTVRGSKPGGGEIFRTSPDRPWGPPSLLYSGYRVIPGGKAAGAWR